MTQDSLAILSKAASPLRSAAALQIGHARLHNALARRPQSTPPIWLMRQAGRYHKHYQALREKYSFMDLCKRPELAAEVEGARWQQLGHQHGGEVFGWVDPEDGGGSATPHELAG